MTTAAEAATVARRAVRDVATGRALLAFYVGVLAVALVGSTQGVEHWIGWSTPASFWATALAELGGVTLNIFADHRRQLGERAIAARILGAAFAAGAIAVQLRGHADSAGHITATGLFFAGFSAAGYVIYLLDSAAKRRDALRDLGKLAETPPAYGAYQWARHPWLTARARRLAVANAEARLVEVHTAREAGAAKPRPTTPLLGRAASLAQAAADIAEERRLAGISDTLRRRIAAGVDPTMAKVAVHSWDLSKVAAGIAERADYPALTELLAAELTPARIHAGVTTRGRRRAWFTRGDAPQTQEIVAALTTVSAPETAETDRETAETAAPAWPGAAPAGTRLLPIVAAAPAPAPVVEPAPAPALPAPIVVRPVPPQMTRRAPETVETARETAETDPAPAPVVEPVDQADDKPEPPLPPVAPSVIPHLVKVMTAHPDWALTIGMPGKHPEALTVKKILDALGITGKQTGCDVRGALLALSARPEAAERFVGVRETAGATA